jgi:hypothetical protein
VHSINISEVKTSDEQNGLDYKKKKNIKICSVEIRMVSKYDDQPHNI